MKIVRRVSILGALVLATLVSAAPARGAADPKGSPDWFHVQGECDGVPINILVNGQGEAWFPDQGLTLPERFVIVRTTDGAVLRVWQRGQRPLADQLEDCEFYPSSTITIYVSVFHPRGQS
jgi:hypothetical protein